MTRWSGHQEEPEFFGSILPSAAPEPKASADRPGGKRSGPSSAGRSDERDRTGPVRLGTLEAVLIGLGGLVSGAFLAAGLLALYLYLTGGLP